MRADGLVTKHALTQGIARAGDRFGEIVFTERGGRLAGRTAFLIGRAPGFDAFDYVLIPRWQIWLRRVWKRIKRS